MPEIVVNKLIKRFGPKVVLRGLDLRVSAGEFVALLGPNGAGKTTLLRILASLSRPTMGTVQMGGFSLPGEAGAVRRSLGVLSHQPILYAELSAENNLRFFGKLYGVPRLESRMDEVLELVGLKARRRDLVRTFSRGMQQRLAIGRAVLHDPAILLLDEPYTGLDQDACEMLDGILKKVASQGRTILMTSHDLVRVAELASRFDVLSQGRIVASTSQAAVGGSSGAGLLDFYRSATRRETAVG